jgi:hypothetical protein
MNLLAVDDHLVRCMHRQNRSVVENPPNLNDDVIANPNPLSNFST